MDFGTAKQRSRSAAFCVFPGEDGSCQFAAVLVQGGGVQWFAKPDLKQTLKQLIACVNFSAQISEFTWSRSFISRGRGRELNGSTVQTHVYGVQTGGGGSPWLCTAGSLFAARSRKSPSCFSTRCKHSWVLATEFLKSSLSRD